MPVWLQDPGAWIAIGISLLFLIAAFVLHHVIVRVLKGDGAPLPPLLPNTSEPAPPPSPHD